MRKVIPLVIILSIVLAACNTPKAPSVDRLWTPVAAHCGFKDDGGAPDMEMLTGPNGTEYPMKIWELWEIVPSEDDNPNDDLEAGICRRTFEIIIHQGVEGWEGDLVIDIHPEGASGVTAERYGQRWQEVENDNLKYDDFATLDLFREEGLEWIYDLNLRLLTSETLFWVNSLTGEVTPRIPLGDKALSPIIVAEAKKWGIDIEQGGSMPTPPEIANLPGWNYVGTNQLCFRSGEVEAGYIPISCEKSVIIHLDDPSNEDDFAATLLVIHPDRLGMTVSTGAFTISIAPSSPEAIVEQYGLANLIPQYCQMTRTVTFRINMYTGAVSDIQVTTCSQ